MENCDLSPFTRMIVSGEEAKIHSRCEARTPRIQSSLGLEPKSNGSWTSSIVSPLGEKRENETLEELPLSESFRSPDSPSPILARRKKISNLNLKRRRLSPYLKSGSLDENNPNVCQEPPFCDISDESYQNTLDKPTGLVVVLPHDENDTPGYMSIKQSSRRKTGHLDSILPRETEKNELSSLSSNKKTVDLIKVLDNCEENFESLEDERGSPILNADVNEVRIKRHFSMKTKWKEATMNDKESKVLQVCPAPAVHNEAKYQFLDYQGKEAKMESHLEELSSMKKNRKFEGKDEKIKTEVTPIKQEDHFMEKFNKQLMDSRRKGPSLGIRRKGLDRTLSGLQLKSCKPFVSPYGANTPVESTFHRPTKIIGLSKLSSPINCVIKRKSEEYSNSPILSLPSKQVVPVKPERSQPIFPVSKLESVDKAKSIFGDDFDSFINEMAKKRGSGFSSNSNAKKTDPVIRAKNIFGKDFESIALEFPNVYQGDKEEIVNQNCCSSLEIETPNTVSLQHHQLETRPCQRSRRLSGFQTGLGKPVRVSEEGLRKAQSLFSSLTEISTKDQYDIPANSLHEIPFSNNDEFKTSKDGETKESNLGQISMSRLNVSMSSAREAKERGNHITNEGSTVKAIRFSVKESGVQDNSKYLNDTPTAFSGFSTASGKQMFVSEASIRKAKAALTDNIHDNDTDRTLMKKNNIESNVNLDSKLKGCRGLSDASGKWALVSDADINKAKVSLAGKDCEKAFAKSVAEEPVLTQWDSKSLKEKPSAISRCQVAFGKPVFMHEAKVMKAEMILDGQDLENKIFYGVNTNSSIQTDSKLLNSPRPKASSGFSTASGKPVFISDTSITKAKEMLADEDCKNDLDTYSSKGISVPVYPKSLKNKSKAFSGFATASGKHIFVSDDSIKKAKAILDVQNPENRMSQDLSNNDHRQTYSNPLNVEPLAVTGFVTAGRKPVSISDSNISEAKAIFDDKNSELSGFGTQNSESSLDKKSNKVEITPVNHETFASASGKKLYEPDLSISEAKKVFADKDQGTLPEIGNFQCKDDVLSYETLPLRNGENLSQSFLTDSVQVSEITPTRRMTVNNPQFTPLGIKKSFSLVRKSIFGKVSEHGWQEKIGDEKESGQIEEETDEFGDDSQDLEMIEAFAKNDPTLTPVDILTRRRMTREEVLKSIKDKKGVSQVAGKLYKTKCHYKEKNKLEDLRVQREIRNEDTFLSCRILRPDDALRFIFRAWDIWKDSSKNIEGYVLADGGCIILSDHNTVGLNEFMNAFYSTPGVDPILCPASWVSNHYKWIVQKLHWMDSVFEGDKFLTPENVLLQLKYRYDREIDRAQRSCLKKIFEQDDSPSKPLSLFVANIFSPSRLELSDGWYSIVGLLDSVLEEAVKSNKIQIGTKLMVIGAILVGAEGPRDPLQKTGIEALRLNANGCRRDNWYKKLGYQPCRESPSIALRCIRKDGGQVPRIKCLISRVYPILYFIRKQGGSLTLNQRMYELFLNESECARRLTYEKILEEVEKEMVAEMEDEEPEKKRRRTLNDEEEEMSFKSNKQEDIKREVCKRMEECNNSTTAVPLIRMRIIDAMTPNSRFSVMLTFWRPSTDSLLALKEGAVFDMFRLNPSSSSGNKSFEISLNTGRGTILRPITALSPPTYQERRCTKISDLYEAEFLPDFFEFDIVAQVVFVDEGVSEYQIVVLRDTSEHSLYLKCWKGVKHYGWNKILKYGAVLAISNIQWKIKGSVLKSYRCGYCTELTVFSESSCAKHLSQPLLELQRSIKGLSLEDVSVYKEKVVELHRIDRKMRLSSSYRTPGGYTFGKDYRTPGSAATIS